MNSDISSVDLEFANNIVESKCKSISGNPYDLNGHHFNPDMYLQKLLKVSNYSTLLKIGSIKILL